MLCGSASIAVCSQQALIPREKLQRKDVLKGFSVS